MTKPIHEIEVEIQNPEGLHMRPAMQFVDMANSFNSEITVSHRDLTVDAKSIMQMTMLAATCGSRLRIAAIGPDARQAIEALGQLVEKKFAGDSGAAAAEKEG